MKKLLALALAFCLSPAASASPPEAATGADHTVEAPAGAHATHANHVGVFLGGTTFLGDHPQTVLTAGLDYERRLSELFGVGLLVDFPMDLGHYSFAVLAAPMLVVHPVAGLKVIVAPGLDYAHEEAAFVARAGIGYDLHLGAYTLAPTFNFDYVLAEHPHQALVFGLALGRGF
ncbi:MAG: hypothetical protein P1V51_09615 [Deltaproteobacteria bacterium]|nr:hypothetical protein [Deltaproteobacteria bacterium]